MSIGQEEPPEARLRLTPVGLNDRAQIKAAIDLGNQARMTLGHLPFAVYDQAAAKGTLLVSMLGDRIVGYALYGLSRGRVRLNHLCVDPDFRGRGIARRLVEWISEHHTDYRGISARCRHDYQLGEMWIKLGFTQTGEGPGRSSAGHIVVNWWRDHHHPNLFTRDTETSLVRAAIDLNILRDMADPQRPYHAEAQALLADHLVDRLELVRTSALDSEINKMDGPLRLKCTLQAQPFPSVHADSVRLAEVLEDLQAGAQLVNDKFPRHGQDELDLRHVADAVASGLQILATRDEFLMKTLGPAAEQHGLRIFRPVDVVLHIDELVRAQAYRPAALLNTGYVQRLIGSGQDNHIAALTNTATGERPRGLLDVVHDLALKGHHRVGVYAPNGKLLAVSVTVIEPHVLDVPLMRVARHPIADTLARQLLFQFRHEARRHGKSVLRITDRHLSPECRLAAQSDGFYVDGSELYAFVLDVCAEAKEVEHRAVTAARQSGAREPAPLRSGMPGVVAAELERVWWPAKIVNSQLATYLVPIQQGFSADLLGVPAGLLLRHEVLGLQREHVYYRSPGGPQFLTPARLLWYMSEGGKSTACPAAVIACSQLESVVNDTPEALDSRFRHLGVWNLGMIQQAARQGGAQALRFSNTEVFTDPVKRERLRALGSRFGFHAVPPQGPVRVPASLFAAIYEEGRRP